MDPARWVRLQSVFFSALELPLERRAAFLDEACDDPAFRREVEAVLAAHERAGGSSPSEARDNGGATGASASSDYAGRRLGPYRLKERIGHGGMSVVYSAERVDDQYRQEVAVKLLRSALPADEVQRRFRVERQVLARLQHPNVAALLDGGVTAEGIPYLVMQYVDGSPITHHADRNALPVRDRLRLFTTVCRAVQFAHANLVIHRDLKPSNILVGSDGQVRLLDFGIARLLDPEGMGITAPMTEELLLLTPEHAAPEQIRGEAATTATDVYALGVLLYELLTGTRPFRATLDASWHRAVCEREPARPSDALTTLPPDDLDAAQVAERRGTRPAALRQALRGDLDQIVLKALRKEPERRYASAEQFAEDVERYLDGRVVLARRDTLGYRAGKFLRRNRIAAATAALALLALFGATVVTAQQSRARALALAQAELDRDRYRSARDQLMLESSRAAQLTTLLMGLFQRGGGDESEADSLAVQRLLERGLARAEALNQEPARQARMLTALGRIQRHIGNYDEAAGLLERSIALQLQENADRRADLPEALIALADVRSMTNRGAEAESLLVRAIAMDSARFLDDHPRIAWAFSQLALVRVDEADYAGAEDAALRALAMQQRMATHDSANIASAQLDVARLLHRRGAYRDAEVLQRQALELRRRLFTRESWQVAEASVGLGNVLLELGRAADAEPVFRDALHIYRHVYGSRHLSVATAANGLASAASELGRYDDAEELFAESLEIRRALFGAAHPRVVASLLSLGEHALRRDDIARAEAIFREALEIQRSVGRRHPSEAFALAGIGRALRRSGDLAGAESALREGLEYQAKVLGDRHPRVAATQLELGLLLRQRGDLAGAEALLRSAFMINEEALDPESPIVAENRGALVEVYGALGRSGAAARTRRVAAPARRVDAVP